MKEPSNTNDSILNSLVDGELDSNESAALLEQLENNPKLQRDLCDIHRIKDMLKMAYPEQSTKPNVSNENHRNWYSSIAASLFLLAIGFGSGSFLFSTQEVQPFALSQVNSVPEKLVLFVGLSDENKFKKTLVKAENFLKTNKGKNTQVNIVASSGGIDFLDKEKSQFLPKIYQLSKTYDALSFIACNNTIKRLKDEGNEISIIDEALIAPTAVQFVVNRLQQGWSYAAI